MVKTHPYSRFVLKTLEGVRDTSDVVLQVEKTDSTFTDSKQTVYLCEVVSSNMYNRTSTADRLTDEIQKVNAENRRLIKKIERLEKELRK